MSKTQRLPFRLCAVLIFLASSAIVLPLGPARAGQSAGAGPIGFLQFPGSRQSPLQNPAALAWAQSKGPVLTLEYVEGKGWTGPDKRLQALEACRVLWYHQGDDSNVATPNGALVELNTYLKRGGSLLLSGAAGRVLNEAGIEPTPLRLLGRSSAAYRSGFRIRPDQRKHPVFAGLAPEPTVLLSSSGLNALADFYGTAGPHGQLLADGNASAGERPVVEYRVGEGTVLFVGWRLADFTDKQDPYRGNLERFFANALAYLAGRNHQQAELLVPPGPHSFVRVLGLPFFRAAKPVRFKVPKGQNGWAAVLQTAPSAMGTNYPVGKYHVAEISPDSMPPAIDALAVTIFARQKPVAAARAAVDGEIRKLAAADQEILKDAKIVAPEVTFEKGPLAPLVEPDVRQSVLLGRSPFMAPEDGWGDITPVYEPVEDGGFRIKGSTRKLNRPLTHGQNRVWTGDVPLFRMDTVTGNGSYARQERVFPLWPRPGAEIGNVNPSMGTLRLGVLLENQKPLWLDEVKNTSTLFRPGYTSYEIPYRPHGVARVTIAPTLDAHGLVCQVQFDRPERLVWTYGGVFWQAGEGRTNQVAFRDGHVEITDPGLPNNLVLAGWDGHGEGRAISTADGPQAEFRATQPQAAVSIWAVWGVTDYDRRAAGKTVARLDTVNAAAWPQERDRLKRLWFDCYIGRALEPAHRFAELSKGPAAELAKTREWWDRRRAEFQIRTPDKHLNALINWARCLSESHRQGPGLVLGGQIWQMYSHISTGWYGKQWAGDHEAIGEMLRFYGAMQDEAGFIRWISPSLVAFFAENNTPYWVDQVWRHYTWTGDRRFVADLWPAVKKAITWQRKRNDPDGDGLFRDYYEYWNCDSNGKGPKAACPSAMSWRMLDCGARLARVVGDPAAEKEYRDLTERSRRAIFAELWHEKEGLLGSIGRDGLWRSHTQTWEQYLAINAGLLTPGQGRRAMRWLAEHYGFEPQPGVRLLACSDWWPLRWSCQWVPTGDTCLAVLAGLKSGDADFWYPWLATAVGSSFRSAFPGINMGISNAGAGGGDREDVDSVDPFLHVAVRGLFGIEPAMDEGRIEICPAFPSSWKEASIRTPDISCEYRRTGDEVTFQVCTSRPLVKRVRANLGGRDAVTPSEKESRVTLTWTAMPAWEGTPGPKPILAETRRREAGEKEAESRSALVEAADRTRLVLFDLAKACNTTTEGFVTTRFVYDCNDSASLIRGWWGNPGLALSTAPRAVSVRGLPLLAVGRPPAESGETPPNVLALSSWPPHPWPAAARIPVGFACRRVWLLWQNYVHPMKNYVPNGEVVLEYGDGSRRIESLVPPYNLDCYFQHFALAGESIAYGQTGGGSFMYDPRTFAHADLLPIECDAGKELRAVVIRATCSEGALGILGMTALRR